MKLPFDPNEIEHYTRFDWRDLLWVAPFALLLAWIIIKAI